MKISTKSKVKIKVNKKELEVMRSTLYYFSKNGDTDQFGAEFIEKMYTKIKEAWNEISKAEEMI